MEKTAEDELHMKIEAGQEGAAEIEEKCEQIVEGATSSRVRKGMIRRHHVGNLGYLTDRELSQGANSPPRAPPRLFQKRWTQSKQRIEQSTAATAGKYTESTTFD